MKNRVFVLLVLLFIAIPAYCDAQESGKTGNADMIVKKDRLWILTLQGTLSALNINTGKIIAEPVEPNNNIVAIDTDRKGNLIISRYDRSIVMLDEATLTFKPLYTSPLPIYHVVFDQGNRGYAITSGGVTDLSTGTSYSPDTSFFINHQIKKWLVPSEITVDANNNIWLGSDMGEWGGELFVFDTRTKKFIKPEINNIKINRFPLITLYGVQAILPVNNLVYVAFDFGSKHPDGHLLRFTDRKPDSVLISNNIWPIPKVNPDGSITVWEGEYAGPAIYNDKDKSIYFYSHYGIMKGQMDKDISKADAWAQFEATKKWTRQRTKGWPVDVLRMAVAPNGKLYLLSQNDGIGVFDGKTFSLLN